MKQNDNKELWELAAINDKDVCFSFIEESVNADYCILSHPSGRKFALWSNAGTTVEVSIFSNGGILRVASADTYSEKEIAEYIANSINSSDNDDLYVEVEPAHGGGYYLNFYHTNP